MPPHILDHADHVGSTRAILEYALASESETMLVATEPHIMHQMEKAAPHKTFIGAPARTGTATATCARTWR
jgi:quinolinate synthase